MSANPSTKLLLAYRSGNKCAMPDCGRALSIDGGQGPINVGKAAHIAGEKPTAARYDPSMTDDERDHYQNLIYLCGECHDRIDDLQQGALDFPTPRLHKIKAEHEQKVRNAMTEAFADIGFPELQESTQWALQTQEAPLTAGFSLIPPEDKLKKNDLSAKSRYIVMMGLSVAKEVRAYIESVSQTDPGFPERLKHGFLQEYHRLKHEGCSGDDLFDLMCRFAQRGFDNQAQRSAGVAVLVYLFEACEVFEK